MFNTKTSPEKITWYANLLEKISIFFMAGTTLSLILRWTQDKIPFIKNVNFWVPALDRSNLSLMEIDSLNYLRDMSLFERFLGFSIEGISLLIVLSGLYCCLRLMRCFRQGELFSLHTVSLLSILTKLSFAWAVYTPLSTYFLGKLVHETGEVKALSLAYSIDETSVKLLPFGFLFVLTLIMKEGYRLKHDQELTI